MWYLGHGQDAGWFERVCFATSTDGYNWHKPDLGLVEYKGSLFTKSLGQEGKSHV